VFPHMLALTNFRDDLAPFAAKILDYGHDAVLLETRRILLKANEFQVDIAINNDEFQSR
jgi:hypothetical protein